MIQSETLKDEVEKTAKSVCFSSLKLRKLLLKAQRKYKLSGKMNKYVIRHLELIL